MRLRCGQRLRASGGSGAGGDCSEATVRTEATLRAEAAVRVDAAVMAEAAVRAEAAVNVGGGSCGQRQRCEAAVRGSGAGAWLDGRARGEWRAGAMGVNLPCALHGTRFQLGFGFGGRTKDQLGGVGCLFV